MQYFIIYIFTISCFEVFKHVYTYAQTRQFLTAFLALSGSLGLPRPRLAGVYNGTTQHKISFEHSQSINGLFNFVLEQHANYSRI